ncbi:MAG: GerMN domain-containing protein [Sporomusaceae bacterium]|jgi:spore germination protein GerM|nr:GerMN domain-containing protein [Sporomusaceae bacterium]
MLKRANRLLWGVGFVLMIFLGGCGSQTTLPQVNNAPNVAPSSVSPAQNQPPVSRPMATMNMYYPDKDAKYLVAEIHSIDERKAQENPPKTAVEILLAGTKNPNLVNVIPAGTKLKSLVVKDGTAYADFNRNLLKVSGGSSTERFLVGSIVNTLTEFPSIKQVQILVEGKKIETITGHMDLRKPLGRSEQIIKK